MTVTYFAPWEEEKNGGVQCPWGVSCLFCVFFGGHLPQTSGFRSAKQILVVSFATQARAFILSDRSIFYTPGEGRTTAGSNAPGAFLVCLAERKPQVWVTRLTKKRKKKGKKMGITRPRHRHIWRIGSSVITETTGV